MSKEYRDKLKSVGFTTGKARQKVTETRAEDGTRTKAVENEIGIITEHTKRGSGVSFRQDATAKPETVYMKAKAGID
jgi:hypothetical protein